MIPEIDINRGNCKYELEIFDFFNGYQTEKLFLVNK